jgi:hypothetical protein
MELDKGLSSINTYKIIYLYMRQMPIKARLDEIVRDLHNAMIAIWKCSLRIEYQ